MKQVYCTKHGLTFDDPRKAQLIEDILDALDRFLAADDSADTAGQPDSEDVHAIKIAMAHRNLSGRALARKAGVSPGTISGILTGKTALTDAMRAKLERAMG